MVVTGLQVLGCEAGRFAPMARLEDQTTNYEWPAFVALNEKLIAGAVAQDLAQEAQAMLAAFPGQAPIVLKDPKARRTLPFWHDQISGFGGRLRALVVLHRPDDARLFNAAGSTRWRENLDRLLRKLVAGPDELIVIPQDRLEGSPPATLLHLAEILGLTRGPQSNLAFQEWSQNHPGSPSSIRLNRADPMALALFDALAPRGAVTAWSADQARALLRDAAGPGPAL